MPRPNPYELAKRREYRRRWWSYAWAESVEFEQRWGFRISAALAILAAVASYFWAGSEVNIGLAILSAVTALAAYLVGVLIWKLITAPSRLAFLEHKREEGAKPDEDYNILFSATVSDIEGGPDKARFSTLGEGDREIWLPTGFFERTTALSFPSRRGEAIIRRDTPLPVVVRLPWRGRLVIKAWTPEKLIVDEKCRRGRSIEFEVYE